MTNFFDMQYGMKSRP